MPRCKYGAKPKNFPGRRNERREAALQRIEQTLAAGTKREGFGYVPLTAEDRARLHREADALALRIRPADELRAIRTKKNRAGQGKLTRSMA